MTHDYNFIYMYNLLRKEGFVLVVSFYYVSFSF